MWGEYRFFGEKRCSVKTGEKNCLLSKTAQKKICSQSWQKNGVTWGGKRLLVHLPERKKRLVSGWERKKNFAQEKKNIPGHASSGPPLIAWLKTLTSLHLGPRTVYVSRARAGKRCRPAGRSHFVGVCPMEVCGLKLFKRVPTLVHRHSACACVCVGVCVCVCWTVYSGSDKSHLFEIIWTPITLKLARLGQSFHALPITRSYYSADRLKKELLGWLSHWSRNNRICTLTCGFCTGLTYRISSAQCPFLSCRGTYNYGGLFWNPHEPANPTTHNDYFCTGRKKSRMPHAQCRS